MRRYCDAALMMNHFDQAVALEHPRRQIESTHHFVVHTEQQQMTEVGVGFDSSEDRNLKSFGEFGVRPLNFGIVREQPMLSEANRAEAAAALFANSRYCSGATLESDESFVWTCRSAIMKWMLRLGEEVIAHLEVVFDRENSRHQENLRLHHQSIGFGRH